MAAYSWSCEDHLDAGLLEELEDLNAPEQEVVNMHDVRLDRAHQLVHELLEHVVAEALEREAVDRRRRHQDLVRAAPEAAETGTVPDRLVLGPSNEHNLVDGGVLLQPLKQRIGCPLRAAGAQLGMPVRENDHPHSGVLNS